MIDTRDGNQHFQLVETELSVESINAIKTELNYFCESIATKALIAVSLLDTKVALFMMQEAENQMNK